MQKEVVPVRRCSRTGTVGYLELCDRMHRNVEATTRVSSRTPSIANDKFGVIYSHGIMLDDSANSPVIFQTYLVVPTFAERAKRSIMFI